MAVDRKKFRISSALKDIIGRELITNDFVAVFELVKNSFDANATRVDIIFEDLSTDHPKLVIKDNGKGMDRTDIEDKWLFVAYSAKKEGIENYRDKIQTNRIHAGAKGIGRFSCDKLGSHLKILSTRGSNATSLHKLEVDWQDFEGDMHQDFIKIPVKYSQTRSNPYKLKKGVVLEITGLREEWGREKLQRLKTSLEKLVNPNQKNDAKNFRIYLSAPDEKQADREDKEKTPWKVVNGKVENRIFEDLGLKTTQIYAEISKNGKLITTRLEDRGQLIYEIVEKNPYHYKGSALHDIAIHLFALNRSAKATFARRMGIRIVEYGSVFLYKNGFRVHPVGDMKGGDIFALDRRKQQHGSSYLGTRDLVGRVEINGDNSKLKETTSRDGGLIKNSHFEQLQEFFYDYALKRLEKFSIDVIKYSSPELSELFDYNDVNRSEIFDLIKNLASSNEIIKFDYDPKILDILEEVSENSLQSILKNFKRIAANSDNKLLAKEARKAERRLLDLQIAKEEAEANAKQLDKQRKQAERKARDEGERAQQAEHAAAKLKTEAEEKTTQNLFLHSMLSQDITNIASLHHHIGISAGTIDNYIKSTVKRIRSGKAITTDDFLNVLERISLQAKKISSTVRFSTKANFVLDAAMIHEDLCSYVSEYLLNVCAGAIKTHDNKNNINFLWENYENLKFNTDFRPMEVIIVLDNLISNSRKSKSSKIKISIYDFSEDFIELLYEDNGLVGIKNSNASKIFDLGYTTTNGSGLGLYQTKSVMNDMNGSIDYYDNEKKGAAFLLRFPS